jgi:hypothetical protein
MTKTLDKVLDFVGCDDAAHDPWGSYMMAFFNVALVLDMGDVEGDVTPEPFDRWEYHPSPFVSVGDLESVAARMDDFNEGEFEGDEDYGVVALASAVVDGTVTLEDLVYVGDVLSRVTDRLRAQGRDY